MYTYALWRLQWILSTQPMSMSMFFVFRHSGSVCGLGWWVELLWHEDRSQQRNLSSLAEAGQPFGHRNRQVTKHSQLSLCCPLMNLHSNKFTPTTKHTHCCTRLTHVCFISDCPFKTHTHIDQTKCISSHTSPKKPCPVFIEVDCCVYKEGGSAESRNSPLCVCLLPGWCHWYTISLDRK